MKLKVLVSNADRNLLCFDVFIVLSNVFLHLWTVDIEGAFFIEFLEGIFPEDRVCCMNEYDGFGFRQVKGIGINTFNKSVDFYVFDFLCIFFECVFVNFRDFIAFVLDADAPWYINIVVIYNRSF